MNCISKFFLHAMTNITCKQKNLIIIAMYKVEQLYII